MTNSVAHTETSSHSPKTLVIGVVSEWLGSGKTLPKDPTLKYVALEDVTDDLLVDFKPEVVLSPLVGKGFDVIDVAVRLTSAGYTGRLRATTPDLPNPKLVSKEIRSVCPDIDFDLLVLSDVTQLEH